MEIIKITTDLLMSIFCIYQNVLVLNVCMAYYYSIKLAILSTGQVTEIKSLILRKYKAQKKINAKRQEKDKKYG